MEIRRIVVGLGRWAIDTARELVTVFVQPRLHFEHAPELAEIEGAEVYRARLGGRWIYLRTEPPGGEWWFQLEDESGPLYVSPDYPTYAAAELAARGYAAAEVRAGLVRGGSVVYRNQSGAVIDGSTEAPGKRPASAGGGLT